MNIAFYYNNTINPYQGGTERITHFLSNSLEKVGYSYIYISLTKNGDDSVSQTRKQYYLPDASQLSSSVNELFCHKLFVEKQIDVLINQDAMNADASFFSKERFPEVKILSVFHFDLFGAWRHLADAFKEQYIKGNDSLIKYSIKRLLVPYYQYKSRKSLCGMYRHVEAISHAVVLLTDRDYEDYPIQNKRKLHVIPNPMTLSISQNEELKKEKMIIFVGRMVHNQKRVDYFLKIWSKLQYMHPEWRAEVLGGGPLLGYYQKLAFRLRLKNIVFRGFVNPVDYYKRAAIMCMTSTYEGFGLVLLEAQAFGCVPVAFDSFAAAKDIISNSKNGYLVKPFDLREYICRLNDLMINDKLLSNMSDMGREMCEKYSVENIVFQWNKLLSSLFKN